MVLRGGKAPDAERQPRANRVPLNYYRSGRPETGSSPFINRKPKNSKTRKFIVRTIDLIMLIVILYVLGYSLLVNSAPKVLVNDTTYHSQADYRSAAAKQLSALKNRNKITLNEQGIIDSLQKQFPEIASATVELPLFSETPIIHLSVAKPTFFLSSQGVNYVIDAQGVATAASRSLPQIKNLTTLTDQSGFSAKSGEQVLSAQNVAFINSVIQQTVRAGVPIKSLVLPKQAEEVDLRTTDQSYYVKFYLGGDPILQTGQFLAARHQFSTSGKQPSQYLDVRVPGKIFFK